VGPARAGSVPYSSRLVRTARSDRRVPARPSTVGFVDSESKICVSCGRTIEWRKKWERNWDEVRYCSDACRKRKIKPVDRELEAALCELLEARGNGKTICPSEAAKVVGGTESEAAWRNLMEPARMAARRLVASGDVEIIQQGRVVDPSTARGPIRIRLAQQRNTEHRSNMSPGNG
jgi:hypothetical protein